MKWNKILLAKRRKKALEAIKKPVEITHIFLFPDIPEFSLPLRGDVAIFCEQAPFVWWNPITW